MVDHEAQADQPHLLRDGRRDHRVHEHAVVEQVERDEHGRDLVDALERDRDDRALGRVRGHAALVEQRRGTSARCARSRLGRSGSARRMRSAASAAATDPGVFDAVKINGSEVSVSSSIASCGPMSAPPHEPSVFENVIVMRSMSSSTPYCSAAPRPALAQHAETVGLVVEEERVRVLRRTARRSRSAGRCRHPSSRRRRR